MPMGYAPLPKTRCDRCLYKTCIADCDVGDVEPMSPCRYCSFYNHGDEPYMPEKDLCIGYMPDMKRSCAKGRKKCIDILYTKMPAN